MFSPKTVWIEISQCLRYPVNLYGCEIWTFKQRDIIRLEAAEMKFMRRTAGYSL